MLSLFCANVDKSNCVERDSYTTSIVFGLLNARTFVRSRASYWIRTLVQMKHARAIAKSREQGVPQK
jgi:hypothetical protein